MNPLLTGGFFCSLAGCLLLTPLVRRYSASLGLMDDPGERKVHMTPTPRGGGIAIFLSVMLPGIVLVPMLISANPSVSSGTGSSLLAIAAGACVLFLTGLADDRWSLSWKLRLGIQLLTAAGVVAAGVRATVFVSQPWFGFVLTVFWILVLTNALNFLDNMDGLSAGIGMISSTLFAVILLQMVRQPNPAVACPLLLLSGALLGFLFWNRSPASIFMGDCGSNLIGFLLATLTVAGTFYDEAGGRHVMLAPLCVMAVPLYDFCTVISIRLLQGRSPFHGDKSHFSHRLVELGLRPAMAVLTIHLTTAMTGLGALLLYEVEGWTGAWIVLLLILLVLAVVGILEFVGRGSVREVQGELSQIRSLRADAAAEESEAV